MSTRRPDVAGRGIAVIGRDLADWTGPVADVDAALDRLQDNRALFARIVAEFVGGKEALVQKLRVAALTRDPQAVAFACHRLGNQVCTFDASRACAVIRALRAAAWEGDWILADRWLAAVEHELSLLCEVLGAATSRSSGSRP